MSKSGGELADIPGWLSRWAVRDGCINGTGIVTTPRRDGGGKLEYTKVTYSCGGITDVITHYSPIIKAKEGWTKVMIISGRCLKTLGLKRRL